MMPTALCCLLWNETVLTKVSPFSALLEGHLAFKKFFINYQKFTNPE